MVVEFLECSCRVLVVAHSPFNPVQGVMTGWEREKTGLKTYQIRIKDVSKTFGSVLEACLSGY
ncbi:MAG: hypothetical protein V8R91_08990 [Butyricimonas faecihominis]